MKHPPLNLPVAILKPQTLVPTLSQAQIDYPAPTSTKKPMLTYPEKDFNKPKPITALQPIEMIEKLKGFVSTVIRSTVLVTDARLPIIL